jgi:SulP family sulfate permease
MPGLRARPVSALFIPALLISIIGFVESISVAQTLAAKKRQRIDPDQELIGLGAANIGAAFTGGYPVTGGFARSVVNFDAGAETPAAGLHRRGPRLRRAGADAAGLLPAQGDAGGHDHRRGAQPRGLLDPEADLDLFEGRFRRRRRDDPADPRLRGGGGVSAGVALSIAPASLQDLAPHVAEVGLVPGTQHFRNIPPQGRDRPEVVTLRIDESLYFANARFLEDLVQDRVTEDGPVKHVVLMCSAVNEIDMSALESLEASQYDAWVALTGQGKGPVMRAAQ